MTRTGWLIVSGLLLGSVSPGCQPAATNVRNVVLTGSAGMAPLVVEIGQRFEAAHPGVRVDVQPVGTLRGVTDTQRGLADIGMVGRPLKPDESSLHATAIARDGMCFIVHKDNPVKELPDDQIVRMYTRGVSNWREVGGKEAPILLVQMAEGHSLLELFLDHFRLKSTQIRADVLVNDSEQGIRAVAAQPNAIAYVSIGRVEAAGPGSGVRVLPSGGVMPTAATVRDGSYPLARPLNLVTRDPPAGLAGEFINFARSPEVADLVQKHHFVPLAP